MKKKQSRDKEIRGSKEGPCTLCKREHRAGPSIAPNNLRRRYYHPQIETYFYRAMNNLFYDPYSIEAIQMTETNRLSHQKENLKQYYSFRETTQVIRSVITHRVSKDFYGWVDFQPAHFFITNAYYLRRKQLVQSGRRMEKYLKNTSELQSTASGDDRHVRDYIRERIKKHLDQQRLVLPNQTNSVIDMEKLTKNISIMVGKIADLSTIQGSSHSAGVHHAGGVHHSGGVHHAGSTHSSRKKVSSGTSSRQVPFRLSHFKDISVIKLTEEVQQMVEPQNYQESYGLDTIKPKQNRGKKVHKLGLRSMDRLGQEEGRQGREVRDGRQGRHPPETPSPRLVHRFQYSQGEEQGGHRAGRRGKGVPLSPCNSSASLSGRQKGGSRNKSSSRRR